MTYRRHTSIRRVFISAAAGCFAVVAAVLALTSAGVSNVRSGRDETVPALAKTGHALRFAPYGPVSFPRYVNPNPHTRLPRKTALLIRRAESFDFHRPHEFVLIPPYDILWGESESAPDACPRGPDGGRSSYAAALRIPDARISMREEMVTLADYDYGRVRAMIARDPADREKVRGFVYIPAVWGVQLAPPVHLRRAAIMLAEAVNRYTGMDARVDSHLALDARRLSSTPFLYITADEAFELTPTERERFGDYLRYGGFAFLDTGAPQYEHGPAEASLRKMLRDALGCHARFEPIPAGHPLYHCFFEFDGPPQGDEVRYLVTKTTGECSMSALNPLLLAPVHYLEGIFLDGILVAVYSGKGYGVKWAQMIYWGNNDPQLKFGVNLLVYALTREGSITARVMERFADMQ